MTPRTRAEATGYRETSRHADVLAFLDALDDPRLHRTSFGTSPEGRELPLLVLSTVGVRTPEDARRADRPVVLVLCGIHAGEVEGKEAVLMLLRELLAGEHPGLLEPLTWLVVPLFNPDGNDRIDPANRALDVAHFTGQLGPDSGVGTRTNASGVNLNRDYLRMEAPEMRLLQTRVWQPWAPDLTIDCHSTNGSVHRFDLTYDIPHPLDSGRPEPIVLARDVLCPDLQRRARGRGRETFFYGNFVEDEGGQGQGWMTYPHHPRFGANYRGLAGRCDLLFEAYSYLPFVDRVGTSHDLLVSALEVAGVHGDAIRTAVEAARTPRARLAVRYRLEPTGTSARIRTRAPRTLDGAPAEVELPHLAAFVGTTWVDRPFAYAVPPALGQHLALHGLATRVLERAVDARVEVATIGAVRESDPRAILEAPGEIVVTAHVEARTERLDAGTWLVETDQPLGAVATYLCEAESDDGFVASGLLPPPAPGSRHPAVRVVQPLPVR